MLALIKRRKEATALIFIFCVVNVVRNLSDRTLKAPTIDLPISLQNPFTLNVASGPKSKLLLGIHCDDIAWQQNIRASYLDYYHVNCLGFPTETICTIDLVLNPHLNGIDESCRILYNFYETKNCTGAVDTVCLESEDVTKPVQVQWLQWASRMVKHFPNEQEWLIAHAQENAMLQPPLLLDVLDRDQEDQRKKQSNSEIVPYQYASTPFIDIEDCVQTDFRLKHSLECQRQQPGRIYWMSPNLIPTMLQNLAFDPSHDEEKVDVVIREWFQSHPFGTPVELRNIHWQHQVPHNNWNLSWNRLVRSVGNTSKVPNHLLWRNLPCAYITAKFGPPTRNFREGVNKRRTDMIWNYGWSSQRLFSYYEFPSWISDDDRWKPHLQFLTNTSLPSTGGGYWFWKSALIDHVLQNDFPWVIYADIDLYDHMEWLPNLFSQLQSGNYDMAIYRMPYLEKEYTKPLVFEEFCGNTAHPDKLWQHAGGFLVLRNSRAVHNLVNAWMKAVSHFEWINDNIEGEVPNGFVAHRHDQSILSTLLSCQRIMESKDFEGAYTLSDWAVEMIRLKV